MNEYRNLTTETFKYFELLESQLKAADELLDYLEHARTCIRSFSEAGEPTPDGGYRQKFKGKWYQSLPVDETPKCDCGLDEAVSVYEKACGERKS